jgi:hypothetical protein
MAAFDLERLYRIPAAADRLDLKPGTVRAMIARGQIAVVRLSPRAIRVPGRELRRLMRASFRPQAAR